MNRIAIRGIMCALVCAASVAARANDTDLTYGGSPRPLTGNTTVRMQSENVAVHVGSAIVTVDCRFTFRNDGPARKIRVGFPDEGGEPGYSSDAAGKRLPPVPSITDFESWVNGKRVKTVATPVDQTGSFWHVKMVAFPANATTLVRDRYTVPVGNSVAYYPLSVRVAEYILHTGASWHGPIGRSTVRVVFQRKGVRAPIRARLIPADLNAFRKRAKTGVHEVYYRGPCKPRVSGATLTFVRTNWRPAKKDDIYLVFDMVRR